MLKTDSYWRKDVENHCEVVAACGVEGANGVSVAIKIWIFVLGSIAVPSIWFTYFAHAATILHLAPKSEANSNFLKIFRIILCKKR